MGDTTAVQRLGHVLGWTGNILAILLVLIGFGLSIDQIWSAWDPDTSPGYSVEIEGKEYMAVGTGYSGNDAARAVQKYLGQDVPEPYDDWKVFAVTGQTEAQRQSMELEEEKVRAIKRAQARQRALTATGFVSLVFFAPAVVVFLLGRALRYIFAGPSKRAVHIRP